MPLKADESGEDEKSDVKIFACTSDLGKSINKLCNVSCKQEEAGEEREDDEEEDDEEEGASAADILKVELTHF